MANKMLIDSTHPEETRVAVVRGTRVEEFDFESQARKLLRGNIYLAKVTRVEPSLQAAFVDFGGNRHGFLAFSEIHPDYYQIPVADRQALLAEEARIARAADADADARERRRERARQAVPAESVSEPAAEAPAAEPVPQAAEAETPGAEAAPAPGNGGAPAEEPPVESVGAGDALEEIPERQPRRHRAYKIQEVIKRRQIMLVQVVKEERGTKGAALTTYLSLAGRYSVLMPNTARGGGISRKITAAADRKRLKSVVDELEVPEGMGVILRTAGASRTKTEIKRDFEYLLRMWETVRELTLKSTAPALVYEEGSLVKRAIRDLYNNKDIDEILVAGEDGYKEAKEFMRMLMPSHAKNIKLYKESQPIFVRYGVEHQLDAMFSPVVQLKSGGYVVINPTEALVAIDVNSGRATREHHIEDTALRTNLEAAEEIARQLRLRDLAGLIVIDFIDMEEKRNNRSVERRLKEHLKHDRARSQVGHISHFGLMEMSRQRMRTGVLESSTEICTHCGGTGRVRSVASVALQLLRAIEDALMKSASHDLLVRTRPETAPYVLNQKRAHLREIETRFGVNIMISGDATLGGQQYYLIERGAPARGLIAPPVAAALPPPAEAEVEPEAAEPVAEEAEEVAPAEEMAAAPLERGEGRRRRRRRGRRGGREPEHMPRPFDAGSFAGPTVESEVFADQSEAEELGAIEQARAQPGQPARPGFEREEGQPGEGRRRRRRGRRGGRRNRRRREGLEHGAPLHEPRYEAPMHEGEAHAAMPDTTPAPEFPPPPRELPAPEREIAAAPEPAAEAEARRRGSTVREPAPIVRYDEHGTPEMVPIQPAPAPAAPQPAAEAEPQAERPRRTGWWRR
jgi:ribonuclease E